LHPIAAGGREFIAAAGSVAASKQCLKALPVRACRGKGWTYATTGVRTAPVWAGQAARRWDSVMSSTVRTDGVE